ncbi:MAG: hypothetical protein Q8K36_06355, partial [Alphaproteobacteria bacterium]|nr:hypothetical protein [Alphaproteobacteria bacterium]
MLFLYFFKQKQLLRFIELIFEEVKNLIKFLKNAQEKSKGIALDTFSEFLIIEKIRKRMQVLGYFYLSEHLIRDLALTSKTAINYRTYIALCCLSALLTSVLAFLLSLLYFKSILIDAFFMLVGLVFGFYLPYLILKGRASEHMEKFEKDIPFFIDLMLIC